VKIILNRIRNNFSKTFYQRSSLSVKQITKSNLPYFFSLIALIIWLDCYVLPVGEVSETRYLPKITSLNIFPYTYPISAIAFILLFDVRKLLPYAKYSAVAAMLGVLAGNFLNSNPISYVGTILAAVAFGHIFTATGYGFFMILNNSEKLYCVSTGILLSELILLLKVYFTGGSEGIAVFKIMQFIGLIPILVCTWFYRKASSSEPYKMGKAVPLNYYTVLILAFIVLVFNDFLALNLWRTHTNIPPLTINIYYAAGVFAGIIVIVFLQQVIRCNICYVLNFSLAILTLGFVSNVLANRSGEMLLLSALLFGASYAMGFISLFYMMGIITKKSRSLNFLRIVLLSIALSFIFGVLINKLLMDANSESMFFVSTLISITILLMVFALTPFFTKILYSGEWTDDLHRPDVTHISRIRACLSEMKLSAKEIEVCILLLEGYTMRQISAVLNIAYSTVNTYCTSIYRKLGINSRMELVVKFSRYLSK